MFVAAVRFWGETVTEDNNVCRVDARLLLLSLFFNVSNAFFFQNLAVGENEEEIQTWHVGMCQTLKRRRRKWENILEGVPELNFIGKLSNNLRFESTIISRKWGSEKLIRRQFAGLIDLTRTSFHPSLWQGNYQSRVPNILQLKKTVQKPLSPLKTICLEPLKFKVLPVQYTK